MLFGLIDFVDFQFQYLFGLVLANYCNVQDFFSIIILMISTRFV